VIHTWAGAVAQAFPPHFQGEDVAAPPCGRRYLRETAASRRSCIRAHRAPAGLDGECIAFTVHREGGPHAVDPGQGREFHRILTRFGVEGTRTSGRWSRPKQHVARGSRASGPSSATAQASLVRRRRCTFGGSGLDLRHGKRVWTTSCARRTGARCRDRGRRVVSADQRPLFRAFEPKRVRSCGNSPTLSGVNGVPVSFAVT